jgi:hypothetical protein
MILSKKEIMRNACCDSNERAPRTVINRTQIQKRKNTKLSKSPKGREYPCQEDQVWVCVEAPDQLADSDLPHDWQKRLKSKNKHGDNLRKHPIAGGVSYIYLYVGKTRRGGLEVSGFALFCGALRTVLPTSQPDGRTAHSSDAFYK